ncbi:NTP transferase domain-containing protein [Candidatus Peregrinibacteria bacterium]|nr:MAG: NTP transferase domain-containing protein [Candidatus Peregrinibacteria bacterium]
MIKKAVLPVAGMGSRFLPATKVIPKELLPIVDKPVVQYLVEEAVQSGIDDIIFVISPNKELIRHHFSHHPELEEFLLDRQKHDLLDAIRPIHQMARFQFVYQDEPLGDGHAVLMAREAVGDEPFVVLFGDDIVKNKIPAARQLMDHYDGNCVVAVTKIPKEQSVLYGMVEPGVSNGNRHTVLNMIEKPLPAEAPSDLGIIGKYVCSPAIFDALLHVSGTKKTGEIRLIDALNHLRATEGVTAVEIEGRRFDTGHPRGLAEAIMAYLED